MKKLALLISLGVLFPLGVAASDAVSASGVARASGGATEEWLPSFAAMIKRDVIDALDPEALIKDGDFVARVRTIECAMVSVAEVIFKCCRESDDRVNTLALLFNRNMEMFSVGLIKERLKIAIELVGPDVDHLTKHYLNREYRCVCLLLDKGLAEEVDSEAIIPLLFDLAREISERASGTLSTYTFLSIAQITEVAGSAADVLSNFGLRCELSGDPKWRPRKEWFRDSVLQGARTTALARLFCRERCSVTPDLEGLKVIGAYYRAVPEFAADARRAEAVVFPPEWHSDPALNSIYRRLMVEVIDLLVAPDEPAGKSSLLWLERIELAIVNLAQLVFECHEGSGGENLAALFSGMSASARMDFADEIKFRFDTALKTLDAGPVEILPEMRAEFMVIEPILYEVMYQDANILDFKKQIRFLVRWMLPRFKAALNCYSFSSPEEVVAAATRTRTALQRLREMCVVVVEEGDEAYWAEVFRRLSQSENDRCAAFEKPAVEA